MINIYNDKCENKIKEIRDNSVNLIILDPPYGTTPLEWDIVLDFNLLWLNFNRILKEDGCVLIFGQEPFSSYVRLSNIKDYRYDWYWVKERLTNVFQVKNRPGKVVETISVFYKNQCKYFPQKKKHEGKRVTNKIGKDARWSITQSGYNPTTKPFEYNDDGTRYFTQVLEVNRENCRTLIHPTQKPRELIDFFLNSYTEKNDLVLDCCMGSGVVGESCLKLERNFYGIEKDEEMFKKVVNRLERFKKNTSQKLF